MLNELATDALDPTQNILCHFAWYKRPWTSQLTYKAWFMADFYRIKPPITDVIILLADLHFLLSGLFIHEYLIFVKLQNFKVENSMSMSKRLIEYVANTEICDTVYPVKSLWYFVAILL